MGVEFSSLKLKVLCFISQVAALLEEKQVFVGENEKLQERLCQAENLDEPR